MRPDLLSFLRPADLEAREPPETRGLERDEVRLLVSRGRSITHRCFRELPDLLAPRDLLVVNRSGTLPASLPARAEFGAFRLNLSTRYGPELWVAEPRWSHATPGPLPLREGDPLTVAGLPSTFVAVFPGIPRLGFLRAEGDMDEAMRRAGEPIRYGYVRRPYPLAAYQTIFASVPGSAEMPSAARPFSPSVLAALKKRSVGVAEVTLHTGVSSLEMEATDRTPPIYPEPFEVPAATVAQIERTRAEGGRVIAVGTTVVRALESAADSGRLRPARGFTRAFIGPARGAVSVDGLLTGFHDPKTTHLAMLETFLDRDRLRAAYSAAIDHGYLWHEFGDSHLILRR